MEYVKLYEDFNPSVSRQRNNERKKKLVERYKRRDEQIKNTKDKGDESKANLYTKRKEVDRLEIQKIDVKNEIINIKEKRRKK